MSGITGFAAIIKDEVTDPKLKHYVESLAESSDALLTLLNEILDVVKLTSGNTTHLQHKFELKKKIASVIQLNQAKALQKKLNLHYEVDPRLPTYVIGDARRLHRIVLELTTNALLFTETGHVKVSVMLVKQEQRTLIIKLVVEDSGIGIPLEKQAIIFNQFKRLTPSYEGVYQGAGLGLAIVKQFINDLDGEIYVQSDNKTGSTFTCFIPLKIPLTNDAFGCDDELSSVPSTPEKISQPSRITATPGLTSTAKNHVLVVEDNLIAATVADVLLTKMGCQVAIAETGAKAVELAYRTTYDLIFMDIGLPDMDGYEVVRRIRLHEMTKKHHVPIVALTAHADDDHKKRCLESGMNAVLTKPLTRDKTAQIIETFIPNDRRNSSRSTLEPDVAHDNSVPIIDIELARTHANGQQSLLDELFNLLRESLPHDKKNIERAYLAQNWSHMRHLAHQLKSSASYCGATRLKKACVAMEAAGNEAKPE